MPLKKWKIPFVSFFCCGMLRGESFGSRLAPFALCGMAYVLRKILVTTITLATRSKPEEIPHEKADKTVHRGEKDESRNRVREQCRRFSISE
jgi:hypothetical protein